MFLFFCGGCNFRCPFCSNASLIPIESGSIVDVELIKRRILENINYLDAVGATGGEPTLQPTPIVQIFKWVKKVGVKTFLNTNGSNSQLIQKLITGNLLDHVAIDVKAPLAPEIYGKIIGRTEDVERIIANIKQSLELCRKAGLSVEIRTTIVPSLIDKESYIREIARFSKTYGSYVLQQYFPSEDVYEESLRNIKPTDKAQLVKLAQASLEEGAKNVYIRTRENGMERVK